MQQTNSKARESCWDSQIQQTKVCFLVVDYYVELIDNISQTPIHHYFFFLGLNPPLL